MPLIARFLGGHRREAGPSWASPSASCSASLPAAPPQEPHLATWTTSMFGTSVPGGTQARDVGDCSRTLLETIRICQGSTLSLTFPGVRSFG